MAECLWRCALNTTQNLQSQLIYLFNLGGRIWPGIIEADVDADGTNEIVIGNSDPTVAVLNKATGIPVWNNTRPNPGEIRAVAVANLDSTPQLELVVGW